MNDKNITVYKILAWIGIILMGVASFLACLGNTPAMVTAGNVILILLASGCLKTLVSTTEGQMVGCCNQMDRCNATGVPLKSLVNGLPKVVCSGCSTWPRRV